MLQADRSTLVTKKYYDFVFYWKYMYNALNIKLTTDMWLHKFYTKHLQIVIMIVWNL